MIKHLKLIVSAMIALHAGSSYGLTLTQEDVVRLALERNENVGISEAELLRAQKQVDSAYSGLFPTLSAQIGLQKSSATGAFMPNADDWNENAQVSLTQPLYTFGRLGHGIDLAKATLSLGQNQRLATQAQVIQTAKSMYYSILFGQALVNITNDSYQNALKNKQTLEKRVSYGRISRNDNLKMQADLASRKPLLVDANRTLKVAKLELANFLALPRDESVEVKGDLTVPTKVENTILDDNKLDQLANVRVLQDSLEISKETVALAKADRLPTLSAFGSYTPSTYRSDFFGTKTREQETFTVGVMLSFDWPFGGGKNDEVEVRRVEQRVSELRLQAGRRQELTRYHTLQQQLESLDEKIKTEIEAVRLAESSYKVALSAFSTGSVSQVQLNDSELLLTQNKISLAQSRLERLNIAASLEGLLTKGNERGSND